MLTSSVERLGSAVVVTLVGRLMGDSQAVDFRRLVAELLDDQAVDRVVADLTDLTWVNSSGLGCLIALVSTAKESNKIFVFCCLQLRIAQILTVTKLDRFFTVCTSKAEALVYQPATRRR